LKLQNIYNSCEIGKIILSYESYTQTDKVDIFVLTNYSNDCLYSFEQKNNHFTYKGSKYFISEDNVSTLRYPELCWTRTNEEKKPKICRAYGYLEDLDRD
jgi:hypothetical protein